MLIVRAAVGCREMIPPFQGPSPGRAVSVQRYLESPRRPGLIIWAGGLSVMRAASQVVSPRKAQISVRTQRPTASRQQPEAHSLLAVQGARLPSSAGAGSGHAPQSMAVPQLSTAAPQTPLTRHNRVARTCPASRRRSRAGCRNRRRHAGHTRGRHSWPGRSPDHLILSPPLSPPR
jgi:hypothetical protein